MHVFARKGYHATRMNDIAEGAGIGKGTIYEYFKNKEYIFASIFDQLMMDYEKQFQTNIKEENDPRKAILRTIRESIALLEEYASFMFVYFEVLGMKDSNEKLHFTKQISLWADKFAKMWCSEIKKGQKKKLINRNIDPNAFARMLFSALDGVMLHFVAFRPDKKKVKNQMLEFEEMVLDRLSIKREDK